MSKKIKILGLVLVAAVLLTAGSATAVMAQDEPYEEETTEETIEIEIETTRCLERNGFLVKVAELLGMTPEELAEVFAKAQQELEDEVIIKYIENAAEQGLITPEEATEIITWWQSRPEVVDELLPWLHMGPSSNNCYTWRHIWGNNGDCTPQAFSNAGEVNKFKLHLQNRVNTTNCAGPQLQATNAVCARQQIAIAR
ncbi:hypothetical protein ACFLVU_00020 [Chloroflexota bacterium]